MTDDDLDFRKPVKKATGKESEDVKPGIRMPTPTIRTQLTCNSVSVVSFVRFQHRLGWVRGMDVYWHIQLLGFLENRPELLIIIELSVEMIVDEGTEEAELYTTIELPRSCFRVFHRQGSKAGQTVRVLGDC